MSLHISSPAFKEGGNIPPGYTKDGQNVSPELNWTGSPPKTSSLVLILHDPDAPVPGGFTHWVVFNLPPDSNGLTEGVVRRERLEDGTLQGKNDSGAACYMGPAPPPGKPHHYHFKLYAVDKTLNLTPAAGRKEVLDAIKGHILDESETTGLYQR
jgi:Raf kinase inhibitor-like YbhB/YbcL family protein